MNVQQFGASTSGETLARINNVVIVVQQTLVQYFEVGDWIGMTSDKCPTGTIIISEPDFTDHGSRDLVQGWHLAWKRYDDTTKTYHWRGKRTARDSRWFVKDPYVIQLP